MPPRQTIEQFITKANIIHNNKYDYSKVVYLNNSTKVIIICPTHGQFSQQPGNHLNNNGCPTCAQQQRIQTNLIRYGGQPACNIKVQQKKKDTCVDRYGVDSFSKTAEFHKKVTTTNMRNLGVAYPFNSSTIQSKRTITMINKYGNSLSFENPIINQKRINTMLNKYGTIHALQHDICKHKGVNTSQSKYGATHYSKTIDFSTRTKSTNLQKYGTSSASQSHMVDILPLIEDYSWLFEQYITQNKTAAQIADELGIVGTTILRYLKNHEIEIKQHFWSSYKCQLWLDQQEADLIPEWKIPGTRFRADGYCLETNTIYEFHGDYWHGNPLIYAPEEINEVSGKSMGELYQKTIERENLIQSLGFNLVVMWETEY
jgi:hypothetical protein